MEKLLIKGGNRLRGKVVISGAKNAAVAILPACLLVNGVCRIENLPDINDVKLYLRILENLGAMVDYIDINTVEVDCSSVSSYEPLGDLTRRMRGSSYLMGALLGRFRRFRVDPPGGCDFGTRPIDMHIKSFELLGATVDTSRGIVAAEADDLIGAQIFFDIVSVGATVNAMLASVLAHGTTIIEGAAREPHVVDLANFLNACGAKIRGAGTDTIRIKGVSELHGVTYPIIPDQIEAGTFMIAAAATHGDVTLHNVIPRHLEIIGSKLIEAGAKVEYGTDTVRVWVKEGTSFRRVNFIALPYPGFPTDMQPQIGVLLAIAEGTSHLTENIWNDRFQYLSELERMGAKVQVNGRTAVFQGVDTLKGASVSAHDLRAGAAMVIAALSAEGESYIDNIRYIERGYEDIIKKLIDLGADIERVYAAPSDK